MHRIDHSTAAVSIPTPDASGSAGYFTEGNPSGSVPATIVTADWANSVQEELIAVVLNHGLTPDKTVNNQLLTAIKSSFLNAGGGYQKLPSGFIIQWSSIDITTVTTNTVGSTQTGTGTFTLTFPNACRAILSVKRPAGYGSTGQEGESHELCTAVLSTSQFRYAISRNYAGTPGGICSIYYIAVGF